jgi:hypothetical protein
MGRYRDAIYYMLLKMVNNASDAEDLTIEAFGKAFKNIQQYTPNYALVPGFLKLPPTTVSILSANEKPLLFHSIRMTTIPINPLPIFRPLFSIPKKK